MIDLNFVKKIDKDWKTRVAREYVEQFNEAKCPYCDGIINI